MPMRLGSLHIEVHRAFAICVEEGRTLSQPCGTAYNGHIGLCDSEIHQGSRQVSTSEF